MRSKIRIESKREKPIDFLAKVILIIEGKLAIPADFMQPDYKSPFNIISLLQTSADLQTLLSDLDTFLTVAKRGPPRTFQSYWTSLATLCTLELDKKLKSEALSTSEDHASLLKQTERDEDLERDAEEMILGKDLGELLELKGEIESTLAADRSMALELQYWSNVLKKIDERIAKTRIESIYTEYLNANREKVMAEIKQAEAKKRSKDDGSN